MSLWRCLRSVHANTPSVSCRWCSRSGRGGVTLAQLDALAFGRGPGSFTGVRIGVGIARGLALGAGLPMIGVSTLATMAQGARRCTAAGRVVSAIDARMGEVYWGEYCRDSDGVWHGGATEAVLNPQQAGARLAALQGSGRWPVPAGRPIPIWRRTRAQCCATGKCCCLTPKICCRWRCTPGRRGDGGGGAGAADLPAQ